MNKLFKGTMIKLTIRQGFTFSILFFLPCEFLATVYATMHLQTLAHRAQNIALILIFVGVFTSTLSDTDVSELFDFFFTFFFFFLCNQ